MARQRAGSALELTESDPERRFLEGRLLELHPDSSDEWDEFWTSTLTDLKQSPEGEAPS